MIDIHAHILPGLDDGAQTLEEAVRLANAACEDGIVAVVATPHADGTFGRRLGYTEQRLTELRQAFLASGLKLEVMPGCEALLTPEIAARAAAGQYLTLNGSRYLLVEWPIYQLPTYVHQALFELRLKGFVPVLAHAERYQAVQTDVNMLVTLVERGALVQVTSGSLLGEFGPEAQRTAEIMLEHGLAHALASDVHSAIHRPPLLSAGATRATRLIGSDAARALVVDTPRAIVEDQPIELPSPRPYRRRPFWAFWR